MQASTALTIGPCPGTGDAEPPTATVQPDTTVKAATTATTCHFMRMHPPVRPGLYWDERESTGDPRIQRGVRTSLPPTNGRSASGTRTEPSSCWWFSTIATIHRVVASVPLSVAAICGLPFSPR